MIKLNKSIKEIKHKKANSIVHFGLVRSESTHYLKTCETCETWVVMFECICLYTCI